jgi:hypothetical protein
MESEIGIFHLVLDASILARCLQNASACHEYVVVLLFCQLICLQRFLRGAIDVSLIEMQLPGIHQYCPRPAVMIMVSIDLTGAVKLIEGVAAQFDVARVSSTPGLSFDLPS